MFAGRVGSGSSRKSGGKGWLKPQELEAVCLPLRIMFRIGLSPAFSRAGGAVL